MKRYLFFHTQSAHVIYHKEYHNTAADDQRLAFESYSLLITTDFEMKSIEADELYCFAKHKELTLAITIVFGKGITTKEEGYQLAVSMLQIFVQQFGHRLIEKLPMSVYRSFQSTVKPLFETYLETAMKKFSESLGNIPFLHLTFLYTATLNTRASRDKRLESISFASAASSLNTDISAIEKAPRILVSQAMKRKYPFGDAKQTQTFVTPRKCFFRIVHRNDPPNEQLIESLTVLASLASDLLGLEKDSLRHM